MASACDHDVRFALSDEFGGFPDRLSRSGARGHAVEVWSLCIEAFGKVQRCELGFLFELRCWGHPFVSMLGPGLGIKCTGVVVPCCDIRSHVRLVVEDAFACAEVNPDPGRINRIGVKVRGFERVVARGECILGGEACGVMDTLVIEEIAEVEVGHFRGEVGRECGSVEMCDGCDRAFPFEESVPD